MADSERALPLTPAPGATPSAGATPASAMAHAASVPMTPAIPPFEPPPMPLSVVDSSRRILWIIALYRAICAAVLLGIALLVDLTSLQIHAPSVFIAGAALYFLFSLAAFWWVQSDRVTPSLTAVASGLLAGDIFFLGVIIVAGGNAVAPVPIVLFPQLASSGWLLRTRTAFFHAALATVVLLGLDVVRAVEGQIGLTQLFQTGLVGFGYFATVGIAIALGRYTKASEDLAAQRGIDVANLEQVNRLIIQDMQDGVLVVDLNGVVRGHNAQVTRLLGSFGRMRGGMRLTEFSSVLHDYWRRFQDDAGEPLPPFKVEATQRLLRVRLVRIGSGLNGGTLIYLEDLGRAQSDAQQMKLAAMGRLTASIAHEVRNPLSAINQAAQLLEEDGSVAPEGQRLLSMIRNNAKRIDRIVGEVLQLNRRDRQQPEALSLREFMHGLTEEIMQAENMPPQTVLMQVPDDLFVVFDRGHFNQIIWNLVRNGWQHCQKKEGSIRIAARAGYMGDAVIFELSDDGAGIPAELRGQIFEPFFTTRPGGTGLGLYIARELADANGATLELLPKGPGAHFRMTLRRAAAGPQ
jgi:two-component system, NtrC family, sensor histidine kinase PilS